MALNCSKANKKYPILLARARPPMEIQMCLCSLHIIAGNLLGNILCMGDRQVPYINIANAVGHRITTWQGRGRLSSYWLNALSSRPRPTPSLCALIRTLCRAAPNTASPNSGWRLHQMHIDGSAGAPNTRMAAWDPRFAALNHQKCQGWRRETGPRLH